MCKQDAYDKLRLKFDAEIEEISVKSFFEKNKKFCDKHQITLAALQKTITRQCWGKEFNYVQKIVQKVEIVQNEIVQKKMEQFEAIADKVIDRNQRHLALWDLFLNKVEQSILSDFKTSINPETGGVECIEFEPKDLKAISGALTDAQKGHRLGEGLDKENVEDIKTPEINTVTNLDGGLI